MKRNEPTPAVLANIYKVIRETIPSAECYTDEEIEKMKGERNDFRETSKQAK